MAPRTAGPHSTHPPAEGGSRGSGASPGMMQAQVGTGDEQVRGNAELSSQETESRRNPWWDPRTHHLLCVLLMPTASLEGLWVLLSGSRRPPASLCRSPCSPGPDCRVSCSLYPTLGFPGFCETRSKTPAPTRGLFRTPPPGTGGGADTATLYRSSTGWGQLQPGLSQHSHCPPPPGTASCPLPPALCCESTIGMLCAG